MRSLPLAVLGLASMLNAFAAPVECSARSGTHVTPLVELYTSEGCSSCPPADRWISRLAPEAAAGRVVPLAFHVNYWDYIGWKDLFASDRATQRQREIQDAAGARYVYTPQVVVGGRDLRDWRSDSFATSADAIRRERAGASIELAVKADPARGIEVTSATHATGAVGAELALLVAVTQNGLSSRVTAGENRGERLAHDFVVRDFTVHRGLGTARSQFQPAAGWNLAHMSVAAFVQDRRTGRVLQAVACSLQ
jgi:hypothetical protein